MLTRLTSAVVAAVTTAVYIAAVVVAAAVTNAAAVTTVAAASVRLNKLISNYVCKINYIKSALISPFLYDAS